LIVVDASVLVAILRGEPDSEALHARLVDEPSLCMTAVNYWEVLARATRIAGPPGQLQARALIDSYDIAIVAADRDLSDAAADSFRAYGRPTPAGLNLGDCYAHALATRLDAPLLFIGADFAKTNVRAA
jgi:ribonuclease VapC